MKLLSIAIPSYNSEAYLHHAVETLLPGGDEVEILIVNDGSKDGTAAIADEYEAKYPGIVRAVHKENGGHGDAVMTGLHNATGVYFKVVDSDDWVDVDEFRRVLDTLRTLSEPEQQVDMFISNYVYDKVGVETKRVIRYANALPRDRVFTWDEVGHFRVGQYMLMHSVIYRRQMLLDCGLTLPKHTFYVDSLYVYVPMPNVKKLYYLDANLYHYFIGREDQSVQEATMIRRMDQQLRVNKLMLDSVDLTKVTPQRKQSYMRNYLEIITVVSNVLLLKSGTPEHLQQKDELWAYIQQQNPAVYKVLRNRIMGRLMHIPGEFGRKLVIWAYGVARRWFNFN